MQGECNTITVSQVTSAHSCNCVLMEELCWQATRLTRTTTLSHGPQGQGLLSQSHLGAKLQPPPKKNTVQLKWTDIHQQYIHTNGSLTKDSCQKKNKRHEEYIKSFEDYCVKMQIPCNWLGSSVMCARWRTYYRTTSLVTRNFSSFPKRTHIPSKPMRTHLLTSAKAE